ncbi:3-oxoacyl-[acyl-carrier-protein] reductase [Arsenicibacter rosenii]|uniref:3-oxoacyl-[acyl-carrier-protein] reductase n=1 Tax=Arsenicibacter rosenii TaxID=1750698 RepID=A0A1S2VGI4_9BACT|nr:3-oxoacyl-[acyl-carrier-protein] reductase [Arsenicibacter rosenii]OIN57871.1 3-oxoacyl-[acyl-carrier-protein] reductase [Arsenicibacter rosenii]
MRLENKVAIITGGARGIGKAAAEVFTREGATVIIWDMLDEGEQTAATLREAGFQAEFVKISVTDVPALEAAARDVVEQYGRIDILINNAGITRDRTLLKMSHLEWQQVIDVNLTGVFNCTKAIVPYMVERGYGRIICTSSVVGIHGNFGQTNYSATKAGVVAMCRTWAKELGPKGITANAVAPGFIRTDMTDAMPEEARQGVIQTIPVKRMGEPNDIAWAYLFLASDEASFVNGQVLGVNGGQAS